MTCGEQLPPDLEWEAQKGVSILSIADVDARRAAATAFGEELRRLPPADSLNVLVRTDQLQKCAAQGLQFDDPYPSSRQSR